MLTYLVFFIITSATYALFSLGLNLQWGVTGLLNFGHVAFMTVGAYTTVLLSMAGVPLVVATLLGAVVAAGLGAVLGISTLRLREDYLAIVTIGASEVIRLIALNEEWLTRGSFGLANYPFPLKYLTNPTAVSRFGLMAVWTAIFVWAGWQLWQWFRRQSDRPKGQPNPRGAMAKITSFGLSAIVGLVFWLVGVQAILTAYYDKVGLMLILVTVLALVYWRLNVSVNAPWGRVLKALREDEDVAKALGKNVFWYKLQALMLGGAMACIAGAFYAWNLSYINPDNFKTDITFYAWTVVILGGAGSNAGTILGALIYGAFESVMNFLPNIFQFLHRLIPIIPGDLNAIIDPGRLGAAQIMVVGFLLIVLMMSRPQGILGKKEELTLGR